MMMPGELYTSMQSDTVYELKKLSATQSNHLFSCRETAVIAHDSSGITTAQEHIGLF